MYRLDTLRAASQTDRPKEYDRLKRHILDRVTAEYELTKNSVENFNPFTTT